MERNQRIIFLSIFLSIFSISMHCMERPSIGKQAYRNIPALSDIVIPHATKQILAIYKNEGEIGVIQLMNNFNYPIAAHIVKGLINKLISSPFSDRDSIVELIVLIIRIYQNADFYNDLEQIINEKVSRLEIKMGITSRKHMVEIYTDLYMYYRTKLFRVSEALDVLLSLKNKLKEARKGCS